jgi:hypothetical protein
VRRVAEEGASMKVYLLTCGELDNYEVVGAFSTREKAERFITASHGSALGTQFNTLDEIEVDALVTARVIWTSVLYTAGPNIGQIHSFVRPSSEQPRRAHFQDTAIVADGVTQDEAVHAVLAFQRESQ